LDTSNSKRYHRIKNYLFLAGIILNIVLLLVFFISGLSLSLKGFLAERVPHYYLLNFLYILIFSLAFYLTGLPLNFYEGYILEHRFNLSRQNIFSWLIHNLKQTFISLVMLVLVVEFIYFVLRNFASTWWIWAGFFWLFLSLILVKITPSVLIPIFYKYVEIDNQELKGKIFSLFDHCNVKLKNIYAIDLSKDTKKANAFICGLGNNRRVVLTDTLLNNFNNEQINSVVAHELGHYKNRDTFKQVIWNSSLSLAAFFAVDIIFKQSMVSFGFQNIDDIALFPLFAFYLLVISLIILPIQNGFSRFLETKADCFSLKTVGSYAAYIDALTKLGEINLADFNPNPFIEFMLYDHPALSRRIDFAEQFKDKLKCQ